MSILSLCKFPGVLNTQVFIPLIIFELSNLFLLSYFLIHLMKFLEVLKETTPLLNPRMTGVKIIMVIRKWYFLVI